jgi:ribonuclease E
LKRMLINAIDPEESRIAVVEDGVLQELHVELASREAYLGNVYKGKVVNIEPSIGAAFVSFGGRVNGFLHVSDVLPAYGRPDFQLEDVIEGRARVDAEEGPESLQQALLDDEDDGEDGAEVDTSAADEAAAESGSSDQEDDKPRRGRRSRRRGRGRVGREEAEDVDAAEQAAGEGAIADDVADTDDEVAEVGGSGEDPGFEAEDMPQFGVDVFGDQVGEEDAAASPDGGDEDAEDAAEAEDAAPAAEEDSVAGDADGASADGEDAEDASERPAGRRRGSRTRSRPARKAAAADESDADAETGDDAGDDEDGTVTPVSPKKSRRRRSKGRAPERPQYNARGKRPTIDQLLKKGQEVVVQITKEGIGSKGPTLTTYVSLPGRCLVLMPSLPKCGVSRKIEDHKERKRLKRIVKELDETGHGGIGFIVRTAGINKSLQDLQRDRDYLKKIWEMVAQRLKVTRAPALLYQESDLVLKAMRDLFTPDISDVVVDNEDVYLRIKDFADKLMPHMSERIKRHELTTPLFHSFGIEKEVEALYQPKVDLPNGASIVIDQAEALVAIDVNSGKFKPGADLEETAFRTNLDATPEIVRQLRLRDLGGLIIIDFIDMNAERHRRQVERRLIESLRGDRARIKVGRISPFGMLEITRQRVGPGLKRTVFVQCSHCKGSGWSRTVQSKALAVMREVRALLNLKGFSVLQVFASPAVNDYLTNHKRRHVLDLEDAVGKTILFKPEPSYPIDVVHYRFLTGDGQEARVVIPAGLGVKA